MPADTPAPLGLTIPIRLRRLQPLWLWPWRHSIQEHLAQGPHVIGQYSRSRRRLGRQRLAEPIPLVGRGCGRGRRMLAWSKQKL
jgi:hypothetical protein